MTKMMALSSVEERDDESRFDTPFKVNVNNSKMLYSCKSSAMKKFNGSTRHKNQGTNISADVIVLSENEYENSDGQDGHSATLGGQFRCLSTVDSIDCSNEILRTASAPSLVQI